MRLNELRRTRRGRKHKKTRRGGGSWLDYIGDKATIAKNFLWSYKGTITTAALAAGMVYLCIPPGGPLLVLFQNSGLSMSAFITKYFGATFGDYVTKVGVKEVTEEALKLDKSTAGSAAIGKAWALSGSALKAVSAMLGNSYAAAVKFKDSISPYFWKLAHYAEQGYYLNAIKDAYNSGNYFGMVSYAKILNLAPQASYAPAVSSVTPVETAPPVGAPPVGTPDGAPKASYWPFGGTLRKRNKKTRGVHFGG